MAPLRIGLIGAGRIVPAHLRGYALQRAAGRDDGTLTLGMRITLDAMAKFKHDPFEGAKERRIMPDTMFDRIVRSQFPHP